MSKIKVNEITDLAGNGPPTFPYGWTSSTMSNTNGGSIATSSGALLIGTNVDNGSGAKLQINGSLTTSFYVPWTAPTLLNSWVNFGGGQLDIAYARDSIGMVHIRGTVKNGTLNPIFVLPVDCRPSNTIRFICRSGLAGFLLIDIFANGNVTPVAYYGDGSNSDIDLTSLQFLP